MKKGEEYWSCWADTDDETGKVTTELTKHRITSIHKAYLGGYRVFLCDVNEFTVKKGKLNPSKASPWFKSTFHVDEDPRIAARQLNKRGFYKKKSAAIRHEIRKQTGRMSEWLLEDPKWAEVLKKELKALRRRLTLQLNKEEKK